jgi:hypothetical protein
MFLSPSTHMGWRESCLLPEHLEFLPHEFSIGSAFSFVHSPQTEAGHCSVFPSPFPISFVMKLVSNDARTGSFVGIWLRYRDGHAQIVTPSRVAGVTVQDVLGTVHRDRRASLDLKRSSAKAPESLTYSIKFGPLRSEHRHNSDRQGFAAFPTHV